MNEKWARWDCRNREDTGGHVVQQYSVRSSTLAMIRWDRPGLHELDWSSIRYCSRHIDSTEPFDWQVSPYEVDDHWRDWNSRWHWTPSTAADIHLKISFNDTSTHKRKTHLIEVLLHSRSDTIVFRCHRPRSPSDFCSELTLGSHDWKTGFCKGKKRRTRWSREHAPAERTASNAASPLMFDRRPSRYPEAERHYQTNRRPVGKNKTTIPWNGHDSLHRIGETKWSDCSSTCSTGSKQTPIE